MGIDLLTIGLSAIGSVVGTISQAQQASAQADFAEYQASVQKQNAFLSREAAGFEAMKQREQNRRALARQRGRVGSSGLQLAGSPLAVIEDLAATAETEALGKLYEGSLRARDANLAASESLYRARQARSGIGASLLGDFLGLSSSLLSNDDVKGALGLT